MGRALVIKDNNLSGGLVGMESRHLIVSKDCICEVITDNGT